ncbi:MAG: hypothetical protein P4L51_10860 [Puia sp.]|nr:hypothetical protein [Puia sp.]
MSRLTLLNISTRNQRPNRPAKILITGLVIAWLFCLFMPGSYGADSWSQFHQVTTGAYDDWFGGAFSWTWRMLWLLTGNYQSMFVLQMVLYWVFLLLLVRRVPIRSIGFWALLLLVAFFSFIPQYVMRDSLTSLLWGIAALMLAEVGEGAGGNREASTGKGAHEGKVIATFLLVFGLWIRTNTVVALLPLTWLFVSPFELFKGRSSGTAVRSTPAVPVPGTGSSATHGSRSGSPWLGAFGWTRRIRWKSLLLSLAVCGVFLFTAQTLTYRVIHATKAYPAFKLKLLDLTGISKLSGENLFPPILTRYSYFHYDTLLRQYTPASFDDIVWPPDGRPSMIPYPDAAMDSIVTRSWLSAIGRHPLLYLRNRWEGFLYYLRIRQRFKSGGYWNVSVWIEPNNALHVQQAPNDLRDWFTGMYTSLSPTCLYSPWFWLFLNTAAFAGFLYRSRRAAKKAAGSDSGVNDSVDTHSSATHTDGHRFSAVRYWQLHAWIQLSGVLYTLSQFPVYQHDRDFRYSYWNVFVTLIAVAAVAGRRVYTARPKLPL